MLWRLFKLLKVKEPLEAFLKCYVKNLQNLHENYSSFPKFEKPIKNLQRHPKVYLNFLKFQKFSEELSKFPRNLFGFFQVSEAK